MRLKMAMINAALGIVLIFFVIKTVGVWRSEMDFPKTSPPANAQNAGGAVAAWKSSFPSEKAFDAVTKKNLFTQSRSDHVPVEEEEPVVEEVVETKIQGKRIALYGVFIWKEEKSALITNPERGRDVPDYLWVKEGEKIKNLTVMHIEEDNILIKDNRQAYRIMIHDDENKGTTRGTGSGDGGSANVIVTSPVADPSAEPSSEGNNQTSAQDGYETVDTPFGQMQKRKN
jgi:hypothetical protein